MRTTIWKRRLFFLPLLCFLLCGCEMTDPGADRDWVVNGEYRPFNVSSNTMAKLMALVEVGDADGIREVFSETAAAETNDLDADVTELVRFLGDVVTDWKFIGGWSNATKYYEERTAQFDLYTAGGTYSCYIRDILKNKADRSATGFTSVTIFPEPLLLEYLSEDSPGIHFIYRPGDEPEGRLTAPPVLETLLPLAQADDADGMTAQFSETALARAEGIPEAIPELASFLREQVLSWELYSWRQETQPAADGIYTIREMFFHLQTADGLYRCDTWEVLDSARPSALPGIFSLSIFPALYPDECPPFEDETYDGYCSWGRENAGIRIIRQPEPEGG